MKIHVILFLLTLFCTNLARADGTFYLVRHAEKQLNGEQDPALTDKGEQRARLLAQQLALANIAQIYSTDTTRTLATAKPLADTLNLDIKTYNANQLREFANYLKKQTGSILIVGHSNTTPELAELLSGQKVAPIDDAEYADLYQIVIIGKKAKVHRLQIFPIP